MTKLYSVTVERTIIVVADDEETAEELAEEGERNEVNNCHDADHVSVVEVTSTSQIPNNWFTGMPYGGDDERTVRDWIEELSVPK